MTSAIVSLPEMLDQYEVRFPEERQVIAWFRELLLHPNAYQRNHLPGHITGSAFIVSEDREKTLLVHHAKLNKWLQPGGHADGETDVLSVAMREAEEETGLKQLQAASIQIFDLDIHTIPTRKDFPQHEHYDVRFLITGSEKEAIVVSEESHDVQWVALLELERFNQEESILRMRDKASRFHRDA